MKQVGEEVEKEEVETGTLKHTTVKEETKGRVFVFLFLLNIFHGLAVFF